MIVKIKKSFKVLIGGLLIVGFVLTLVLVLEKEDKKIIQQSWKLESMTISGIRVDHMFSKEVAFIENNKAILPKHDTFEGGFPIEYSKWKYQKGYTAIGKVVIDDKEQDIFTGEYEINHLKYSEPEIVLLKSDSIKITLKGFEGFSIGKPTIRYD